MVEVGVMTYVLFLVHYHVIVIMRHFVDGQISLMLATLIMSLIAAFIYPRYFERRFNEIMKRSRFFQCA